MLYVSDVQSASPQVYQSPLQEQVYRTLENLKIPFQRVDTDEAITMEDCILINQKLDMDMVKTLFLCNRQQTEFYLFITRGDKPFISKDFSSALNISRVSFAPADAMETMLGTRIGAATIFSALLATAKKVQIVFDKDILSQKWYGCSDGTTTGYMKIETEHIVNDFLTFTKHTPIKVIEV